MKAVIGPHAGFAYSGPNAAWAYKNIDPTQYDRVLLLGPSHSLGFQQIGLTSCSVWKTPIGDFDVDLETTQALLSSRKDLFIQLQRKHEEAEHSLEMHLPFIRKIFSDAGKDVTLLPMMVGQVPDKAIALYGEALKEVFLDARTLVVVSSDFCHWGDNFDYKPLLQGFKENQIHASIEKLDKMGMDLIAKHDLAGFQKYLQQTQNTICGERPIKVLLAMAAASGQPCETAFVKYDQSDRVTSGDGCSVSYASSYTCIRCPRG